MTSTIRNWLIKYLLCLILLIGPVFLQPAEQAGQCPYTKPKVVSVKEYVQEHFKDIPILIEIARCESQFQQFNKDGSLHRGEINPKDVGVFQINEDYHLEASRHLGFDITTLEGNSGYARYLYNREGTRPWLWSAGCWNTPSNW